MTFDRELLASYKALLQRTNLQKAYQEFVRLFRYLRVQLESGCRITPSKGVSRKTPWIMPISSLPAPGCGRRG